MKMVRVLGVLPGFVGFVCLILVTASLVGINLEETRVSATTVPCLDDDAGGCPVGMTGSNFYVPPGFSLLDVQVTIEWSEPAKMVMARQSNYHQYEHPWHRNFLWNK